MIGLITIEHSINENIKYFFSFKFNKTIKRYIKLTMVAFIFKLILFFLLLMGLYFVSDGESIIIEVTHNIEISISDNLVKEIILNKYPKIQ